MENKTNSVQRLRWQALLLLLFNLLVWDYKGHMTSFGGLNRRVPLIASSFYGVSAIAAFGCANILARLECTSASGNRLSSATNGTFGHYIYSLNLNVAEAPSRETKFPLEESDNIVKGGIIREPLVPLKFHYTVGLMYGCNYQGNNNTPHGLYPCCTTHVNPDKIISCHNMSPQDFDAFYKYLQK